MFQGVVTGKALLEQPWLYLYWGTATENGGHGSSTSNSQPRTGQSPCIIDGSTLLKKTHGRSFGKFSIVGNLYCARLLLVKVPLRTLWSKQLSKKSKRPLEKSTGVCRLWSPDSRTPMSDVLLLLAIPFYTATRLMQTKIWSHFGGTPKSRSYHSNGGNLWTNPSHFNHETLADIQTVIDQPTSWRFGVFSHNTKFTDALWPNFPLVAA